MSLFWRLFLSNVGVVLVALLVLVLSPLTVADPLSAIEVVALVCGALVVLAVSASTLRRALRPLARLRRAMAELQAPEPSPRSAAPAEGDPQPEQTGQDEVGALVATYHEMLDRLQAERSMVARATLTGQEDERQRVARELHDEVGQSLTVVLLTLSRINQRAPQALSDDIELALDTARSSLTLVRDITSRLRPPVLDDLGLAQALVALTRSVATGGGLLVRRQIDHEIDTTGRREVDLVVYRIAQEALTNVVRHSGAAMVWVRLDRLPGGVVLQVRDNGCGALAETGNGVTGMRERARLIQADLSIVGQSGLGTSVRLRVPIPV